MGFANLLIRGIEKTGLFALRRAFGIVLMKMKRAITQLHRIVANDEKMQELAFRVLRNGNSSIIDECVKRNREIQCGYEAVYVVTKSYNAMKEIKQGTKFTSKYDDFNEVSDIQLQKFKKIIEKIEAIQATMEQMMNRPITPEDRRVVLRLAQCRIEFNEETWGHGIIVD